MPATEIVTMVTRLRLPGLYAHASSGRDVVHFIYFLLAALGLLVGVPAAGAANTDPAPTAHATRRDYRIHSKRQT
jgi:hypothetical protein